jgi:hypothetical protein
VFADGNVESGVVVPADNVVTVPLDNGCPLDPRNVRTGLANGTFAVWPYAPMAIVQKTTCANNRVTYIILGMGYTTKYSLNVDLIIGGQKAQLVNNAPLQEVINKLRATNEAAKYSLCEDGGTLESTKWYEHESDLREYSKKNPHVLFTLHGEGEENEDIWNKYFLDGKLQVAKAEMRIAEFDPTKLK